ncbi:hypothetical protein ACIBCT_17665 [Streptosporangium sp. NPDC050855]|uniref:hypothetical protein n=1 Tax=Streptosporangium sp. NPDC050855 TaxID=3366194 RepID=UPI0037A028FE
MKRLLLVGVTCSASRTGSALWPRPVVGPGRRPRSSARSEAGTTVIVGTERVDTIVSAKEVSHGPR